MTTSYDIVPYPSTSHIFTHPNTLATAATLLGLDPTPIEHCRMLEVGCASGGNLIPMALELPESEFVGIDVSSVQIAEGQAALEVAGTVCRNVALKHMDIMDVNADLGQFDYIVAHGIFSWVPGTVRDKLLAIYHEHLTPNGVAYISYNTYPGWHMLGTMREMMLYHTRDIGEPQMRIAQARALVQFLSDALDTASQTSSSLLTKAYASFLKSEQDHLGSSTDSYLFHEELEEVNDPLYFYEFAAQAARHGLQYLCEANLGDVFLNDFPAQITEQLLKMAHDTIELEQYMDFLRNRTFRKTLLVHQAVPLSRKLRLDRVPRLYAASNARPVSSQPNLGSISIEEFSNPSGLKLATDHPVTKAAMQCLNDAWPGALSFNALLDLAYARLNQPGLDQARRAQDAQVLAANLLRGFAYSSRLIELGSYAPRFATEVSECPVASPWARYQAQTMFNLPGRPDDEHPPATIVTSLCHERVEIKGLALYLLGHLDGSLDHAALLEGVAKSVLEGSLVLKPSQDSPESKEGGVGHNAPADMKQAKQMVAQDLDETLRGLARAALLVA